VTFHDDAWFAQATFQCDAEFDGAEFWFDTQFAGVTLSELGGSEALVARACSGCWERRSRSDHTWCLRGVPMWRASGLATSRWPTAGAHNLDKLRLEADLSFATAPSRLGRLTQGGSRLAIAEERAWRASQSHQWAAPGGPSGRTSQSRQQRNRVRLPGCIALFAGVGRTSRTSRAPPISSTARWRCAATPTGRQTVLGRAAPWTIEREIRKARAKINGLPEGFRFHDLRHYYASLLIASGADVKVVQHRLRHASAKTTLTPTGTSGRTATSRRGPLSNRRCRALLRNTEEPRTLALTFCWSEGSRSQMS
jgi:hypothetical protein